MDEDLLNDLKQFIAATVSQATVGMATKDDIAVLATKEDLQKVSQDLNTKIDDLELKVDTISEALNDHLSDHETGLTKLEQQAT
jgi:hypothetical protein